MPNHVRIPPVKHYMNIMNKQASNMAACLLKQSKTLVTATAHAQTSQTHCSAPLEAFSYTKHAKTCQDTTCQTYLKKQASNMSVDLQRAPTISYSTGQLRRQAVESQCRVRCHDLACLWRKSSYTGQFCKRSSVAAALASNLSVNARR